MLYKVLDVGGHPLWGGSDPWSLPTADGPGDWMPKIDKIRPCVRGYHLCDGEEQLLSWLGPVIYEAEGRGDRVNGGNKVVFSEARLIRRLDAWNERSARLFACECACRVLHLFERKCPQDLRPRQAIETAVLFAEGLADEEELVVARQAALDVIVDYAWAAQTAAKFAVDVCKDSVMAAVRAVAGDVGKGFVKQSWQAKKLGEYLHGNV